jgi:hypothetical protein
VFRQEVGRQRGQAAVELLAALPIAVLIFMAGWQVVLAGHAWWTVTESARLAARAAYVTSRGASASGNEIRIEQAADRAAAKVLPGSMRNSRKTVLGRAGAVTVSARLPLAGPFEKLLGGGRAPRLTARSRFGQ